MMTGEQYRKSLLDGRRIYLEGERIEDPSRHPLTKGAVDWIASTYDRFYSSEPDAYNPMYLIPESPEDIATRMDALVGADLTAATTAACMALVTVAPRLGVLNPEYRDRIYAYIEFCRNADLRCAEVITDAKGHRMRRPNQQDDPDFYVHIVDRTSDGIVITGAKMHITGASLVHELVVLPTKRMLPGEEEYAVACAVPVNAPGVTIIDSTAAPANDDIRHYPVSGGRNMPDGLVVFDKVFVPNDRVFLDGEVSQAASLAHALGLWERASAVAGEGGGGGQTGLAALLADMHGVLDRPEVRERLTTLIMSATMSRAGWQAAMANADRNEDGKASPSPLFISATKYYTADLHSKMVDIVLDIAGTLVVTCPTIADLENPEIGGYLEECFASNGLTAAEKMRVFHTIRDRTADRYGGWAAVTSQLAGGGQYAQRMVVSSQFNLERAEASAKRSLGIGGPGSE